MEFDAIGVVDDAAEDGVGQGRLDDAAFLILPLVGPDAKTRGQRLRALAEHPRW